MEIFPSILEQKRQCRFLQPITGEEGMLYIRRKENEVVIVECAGHKVFFTVKHLNFEEEEVALAFEGDKQMIVYRAELASTRFPSKLRRNVPRKTL